jgi:hypothetical protein
MMDTAKKDFDFDFMNEADNNGMYTRRRRGRRGSDELELG